MHHCGAFLHMFNNIYAASINDGWMIEARGFELDVKPWPCGANIRPSLHVLEVCPLAWGSSLMLILVHTGMHAASSKHSPGWVGMHTGIHWTLSCNVEMYQSRGLQYDPSCIFHSIGGPTQMLGKITSHQAYGVLIHRAHDEHPFLTIFSRVVFKRHLITCPT